MMYSRFLVTYCLLPHLLKEDIYYVNQGSQIMQDHASLPLFSNVTEDKFLNVTILCRTCVTRNYFDQLICIFLSV